MTAELELFFLPNGEVLSVYDPRLHEMVPGHMQVHRFSNVEWSEPLQRWEARDLQGQLLCFDVTRDGCLAKEHELAATAVRKECGFEDSY